MLYTADSPIGQLFIDILGRTNQLNKEKLVAITLRNEDHENKANALKEKLCPNLWPALYTQVSCYAEVRVKLAGVITHTL